VSARMRGLTRRHVAVGLLGPAVVIAAVGWRMAVASTASTTAPRSNSGAATQAPPSCTPPGAPSTLAGHAAHAAECASPVTGSGAVTDGGAVAQPVPTRSFAGPPPRAGFHEFPANCTVTHRLTDDPIVFPGKPNTGHNHTFIGNPTTTANTTPETLVGGRTSCQDARDASSYWFPTLLQNGNPVLPEKVTVYYKSGVSDYRTVLPFPAGFRLIVGDMHTPSAADFTGTWTCGTKEFTDIPASCPAGSSLIVRLKAPSCWDNVHLDTPDHKSHMAYPVNGVCPADHPVPLPMLQMKVPYKLPGGNTAGLAYSSGPSFSFHYDFMNGWDPTRQAEVIAHCVNGGRQCNGDGIDRHRP
jgi:hypothetical protein